MPIIYEPFRIEINREPEILSALEDEDLGFSETPMENPAELVILERNGIHYINNRALHPDEDTEKSLNPKFLSLVESVIKPDGKGPISSRPGD
ncbi:MAG: hypothetical protein LBG10_06540 [Treponema sp.]|jgi:hypothetical protein|nr:hypothetical protein [Treponema sp.]